MIEPKDENIAGPDKAAIPAEDMSQNQHMMQKKMALCRPSRISRFVNCRFGLDVFGQRQNRTCR